MYVDRNRLRFFSVGLFVAFVIMLWVLLGLVSCGPNCPGGIGGCSIDRRDACYRGMPDWQAELRGCVCPTRDKNAPRDYSCWTRGQGHG